MKKVTATFVVDDEIYGKGLHPDHLVRIITLELPRRGLPDLLARQNGIPIKEVISVEVESL